LVHVSPLQHAAAAHGCPRDAHEAPVTQEPVVWPAGTWQIVPTQQSAVAVHGAAAPPHVGGGGATHFKDVQRPEQQSPGAVHALSFGLQVTPPSAPPPVPPSGAPPSAAGGTLALAQNPRPFSPWKQVALSQHWSSLVHASPSSVHVVPQTYPTPLALGKQGASPQH
jgi:hypothetical protein